MLCKFPVEIEQGDSLPSCFCCHIVSKCPLHGLFSAMFYVFLSCLLVLLPFEIACKLSTEGLSSVPKHKKVVMYLMEKIHVLNKLRSGMSYVDHGFNATVSKTYIK